MSAMLPLADPRLSGVPPSFRCTLEQELVLLIPPNSLEWKITLAYFSANVFTHYLNFNRDLKTPNVVAYSHFSPQAIPVLNIPIP